MFITYGRVVHENKTLMPLHAHHKSEAHALAFCARAKVRHPKGRVVVVIVEGEQDRRAVTADIRHRFGGGLAWWE